jgi:hypothetical protein
VKKMWRGTCILGSVVIALAVAGSGSAFAANRPSPQSPAQAKAQWQDQISNLRTPGRGCYHASYPSLQWHATPCLVAPNIPLVPRISSRGGPLVVGNGSDYVAEVKGKISKATGTFKGVSSGITEKGQINATGPQVKNAFTLQLNSQFFADPPACSGALVPSSCEGWQQFVYAFHYSGSTNEIFMQYWMLFYDKTCPRGWNTVTSDGSIFCYTNSPASSFGSLPASSLGKVALVGKAVSGGNDSVTLSTTGGSASTASNNDSKLDLAAFWNTTEWGVFGDAGGGQANFSAKATLEAVTTLTTSKAGAPTCVANDGTTGETNNLKFNHTPAITSASSPTMASSQTDGAVKKPSCAVKA